MSIEQLLKKYHRKFFKTKYYYCTQEHGDNHHDDTCPCPVCFHNGGCVDYINVRYVNSFSCCINCRKFRKCLRQCPLVAFSRDPDICRESFTPEEEEDDEGYDY
jgi:hypothetical protein